MAEIKPLSALHYNLETVGPLEKLIAPPYDVIDAEYRRELASRSPYNVVGIDLPQGENAYGDAGDLLAQWIGSGALLQDPQPALWAIQQDFEAPDGSTRTRRGFFCRVRLSEYGRGKVRPHERTHPAAKEDRLRLMRATRANLSPIFSLFSDQGETWRALEPHTASTPWATADDDEKTTHSLWRIDDQETVKTVAALIEDRELLIADGHHRYETARTYADEIGGEGDHRYVLMCLVSMADPGLAVFPTHRLVGGIDDARRQALQDLLKRDFKVTEIDRDHLAPEAGNGLPTFGFFDHKSGRALRLELASQSVADRVLADHSASYRQLDTAVLEKLVLQGPLALTEADISHQHGLAYARNIDQTMALLQGGDYELAFMLRPTPIDQVQAIAEAGETMPPKSTYFFPKLPSGLLFNPLA